MNIDSKRLYTYPVLADGRDDYKAVKFSVKCDSEFDAENLILNVNFSTDCARIKDLIAIGDAEYLLHVESSLAFYRETFTSREENFSCTIKRDRLKKNLECLALIVLKKSVDGFFCDDWNEDFSGLDFKLQKGTVLAYQNFQPLTIPDDPKIFKNVASIFSVYKRPPDAEKAFKPNLEDDKIKIGLNEEDYAIYRRHCANPTMQPILNALTILPTLVYVFEVLRGYGFSNYGELGWFNALANNFAKRGVTNLADYLDEKTSLELAQEVMQSPLTKSLKTLALVYEDAVPVEEDD